MLPGNKSRAIEVTASGRIVVGICGGIEGKRAEGLEVNAFVSEIWTSLGIFARVDVVLFLGIVFMPPVPLGHWCVLAKRAFRCGDRVNSLGWWVGSR